MKVDWASKAARLSAWIFTVYECCIFHIDVVKNPHCMKGKDRFAWKFFNAAQYYDQMCRIHWLKYALMMTYDQIFSACKRGCLPSISQVIRDMISVARDDLASKERDFCRALILLGLFEWGNGKLDSAVKRWVACWRVALPSISKVLR